MRGATVLLLALLTRALNHCSTSLSLRDAERHNYKSEHSEDRAFKVSKALTFNIRHIPITCQGYLVEKYQFVSLMILSVEKPETFSVQTIISRCPILCLCEVLNRQLGEKHKLELNQTNLGLNKVFKQSSSMCFNYGHLCLLLLNSMNRSYLKNGAFSGSGWAIAIKMCEMNVKNHTGGINCVCIKVHIFMAAEDQVDITEKVCIITEYWFVSVNFNASDDSHAPRLSIFLPVVKPSEPAVKALTGTFLRKTAQWTMATLICVHTTIHCKLVLSLHRSLNMISLMRKKYESCTYNHCADIYQFIWKCALEKQRELNQMVKSCFRSNMLTCTDTRKHKEMSPLHWQICAQLLSGGLFHQWIMKVLLITVSLSLIGQTAVVTYMRYTQRFIFTHRARNLTFVQLFTISWCSLSPLTRQPTGCSCKLHHKAFGITFVLCISCVLGKTIVVLMAFKAKIPDSNIIKCFGRLPHKLSVPAVTMTQILVLVFWFSIYSPPFYLCKYCFQEKMILQCNVLSVFVFCLSFYHFVRSFVPTFLVCNLPFTIACYSVLNIHAIMVVTTRISLRILLW